ncbi:hypothetical protein FRB96_009390 [Tulasnella sp. 330]|nr:hypothetical protein FRB96_009390 [Tulasnella sp. 330]
MEQSRPSTVWGQPPITPPAPPPVPPVPQQLLYLRPALTSSPGAGPSSIPRASSYMDPLPEYAPAGFVSSGVPDAKVRPPPPPKPYALPSPSRTVPVQSAGFPWNLRPPSASLPSPPPLPVKNFTLPSTIIPLPPPLPPKIEIPSVLSTSNPFDDRHQSDSPLPNVLTDAGDYDLSEEDPELAQALRASTDTYNREEMTRRATLPDGTASEEEFMRQAVAMSLAQQREEQMEALRRIEAQVMARTSDVQPADGHVLRVHPPSRENLHVHSRPLPRSTHSDPTVHSEATSHTPAFFTSSSAPRLVDLPTISSGDFLRSSVTASDHGAELSPAPAPTSWDGDSDIPLPQYEEVVSGASPANPQHGLTPATPSLTFSSTPTSESSRSRSASNASPLTPTAPAFHMQSNPPTNTPATLPSLGLNRSPSSPMTGASPRQDGSLLSHVNKLRMSRSFTGHDLHDQLWGSGDSATLEPVASPMVMPVPEVPILDHSRAPTPPPAGMEISTEPVQFPAASTPRQIILEREYAEGVSFGYHPPNLDMNVLPEPPPLPETIIIHPTCAFHISAPSWHQMLRLLARIGDISLQPSPEAYEQLPDSGELSVRLVLHFHKCRYGDQWRTILWVDLNRSLPQSITPKDAWPYINGDTTVLPYQCQIPRNSGVFFQLPANGEINAGSTSITYVLPQRFSPTLPMRMEVLASALTDAYRASQVAVSTGTASPPLGSPIGSSLDVGLSSKRLSKAIEKCYNSSGKPKEKPVGGVIEVHKKHAPGQVLVGKQSLGRWLSSGVRNVLPTSKSSKGGKHGNDENYDLVTPFTG